MTEIYRLQQNKAHPLNFDRTQVLSPDVVSESLGVDMLRAIRWRRYLSQNRRQQERVLVPGIGSGILICSMLAERKNASRLSFANGPLHIDAFDINSYAVETAQRNVAPYTEALSNVTVRIFEGDWKSRATWAELDDASYSLCAVNPPYLDDGNAKEVRSGYEHTPRESLFSSNDGLAAFHAYRHLAPNVAAKLMSAPGTAFIGRYSTKIHQSSIIREILSDAFTPIHPERSIRMFGSEGRLGGSDREISYFHLETVGMGLDGQHVDSQMGVEWLIGQNGGSLDPGLQRLGYAVAL